MGLDQAEIVLSALRDSDAGKHRVVVRLIDLPSWLKTLTAVRLSLAMRLGIRTADDADEHAHREAAMHGQHVPSRAGAGLSPVTTAVVGSQLGVAGTIIGAAFASVVGE